MSADTDVPDEVLESFGIGRSRVIALSGGRTNRTFRATAGDQDLVLQHVRHGSHDDLLGVMENLVRVTGHLDWKRLNSDRGVSRWYPELVPTAAGKPFVMTPKGDVWRAFTYRPGMVVRRAQRNDTLASIAALYGRFAAHTDDLVSNGAPELLVTTHGFHDLDAVWATFQSHLEQASPVERAQIDPHLDRVELVLNDLSRRVADDGLLSIEHRVVHNDTKLSNTLVDHDQGQAIAVLDLDLVMMGPVWHDFGDLIRSASWHRPGEIEPGCGPELFDVVARGYLDTAGDVLSAAEVATFAVAGPRIAAELGLRYLTDHCRPEPRLSVSAPGGHQARGLSNLWLAEEMLNAYDALRPLVDQLMSADQLVK